MKNIKPVTREIVGVTGYAFSMHLKPVLEKEFGKENVLFIEHTASGHFEIKTEQGTFTIRCSKTRQ